MTEEVVRVPKKIEKVGGIMVDRNDNDKEFKGVAEKDLNIGDMFLMEHPNKKDKKIEYTVLDKQFIDGQIYVHSIGKEV